MNRQSRICVFTISLSYLLIFLACSADAQDANVDAIKPTRITDSLITRSELNRLLNQPAQDTNPLRRAPAFPEPILDANVQRASWQDEDEPISSNPVTTEDSAPAEEKPTSKFDAESFIRMFSQFGRLDMTSEISVDDLKQEIAQQRSTVETSIVDDDARTEKLRHLEIAAEAAQQAVQHITQKADYQSRVLTLDEELERLKARAKVQREPTAADTTAKTETMQALLDQLQAKLDHENSLHRKVQDLIKNRDERMARIPTERLNSRELATELHEELSQKQAIGTEGMEVLLSLRARELEASTNVQFLDQEATWHDLSREKLPLEKSIHQRNIQRLEQEIESWNKALAARKQAELEKQIRDARSKAMKADPELQEFSRKTAELAQARADLAEKIGKLQEEKLKVSKQKEEVHDQFQNLDTTIRESGEESSSELLIKVHRNLIRPFEGMARVRRMESELKETSGTILRLREEQEDVADVESFIEDQLKIEKDEVVADTTLFAMAEEAVQAHHEQLTALEIDNEKYKNLLNQVLPLRKELIEKINATRDLIDIHALWIQSADPFSVELLAKSGEGAQEFFDYDQWHALGCSIAHRVTHRPYECVLGLFGIIVAFTVGRRFKG